MHRVVLDCDNTLGLPRKEIDDGLTLYYLLGRKDVDLVGITTTFGNGPVEIVQQRTQRMLDEMRQDIPLALGAPGAHGVGSFCSSETAAARFLVDTVAAHPGQITLIAIGPLTNLYGAALLDPGFYSQVAQIVCMGGILQPLRIGWRTLDELNFSSDPEAAFAVLSQAECPVVVMNAHLCLQAFFDRCDLVKTRGWKYNVHRIIRSWLWTFGLYCGVCRFYLWDLVAAAFVTCPMLFQSKLQRLQPGIEALNLGYLTLSASNDDGIRVNMPTKIIDTAELKRVLFAAWSQVLAPQNHTG
jgi:inosine-uridine nucleoside N-ribohydrolase